MNVIHASFDRRFLQQFVGTSIISNPRVAIVELIANAWDAGATRVDIKWPTESHDGDFRISDNGHGMNAEQFRERYMRISYNREEGQGLYALFPNDNVVGKRRAFGKNGIGRLAAFCFADSYTVETSTDGKTRSAYLINKKEGAEPLEANEVEPTRSLSHSGTVIATTEFNARALDIADLRQDIGMRFLSDPNFHIFINNEQVNLLDIPKLFIHNFEAVLKGGETVSIVAIDTARPDGNTNQHGVAWHVNGRLVGECKWRGPNGEKFLDGRKSIAKRFTFIVKADSLANAVKPDWTGFNPSEPLYVEIFESVSDSILKFIANFFKGERTEFLNKLKDDNQSTLQRLSPLEIQNWEEFVIETQEKCYNLTDDTLTDISKILANLLVANSRFALLHKLSEYDPNQLDDLNDILAKWTVDMAKIVLDELAVRMLLVKDLQIKIGDKKTDELKDLQPLFEKGLWIFGPEYESIHYTSNKGITNVLKTLFNITETGSRNRPDFVVLPDGNSSIGAYAVPKFDDQDGGEIGTSKVIIVELKKPGIPISSEQKEQCWKYVKELRAKSAIQQETDVVCFVLGSEIDSLEENERKEGKTIIRPLTYNTIISRANSRLLNLKEKVESAPFLKEHGLDEFIERDKSVRRQKSFEGI